MMANDTYTTKWNEKGMETNEGLRTLECLRGRLLAERAASKAANDESEQIGKKVLELEKQLKMEVKSRNKAEKRLNFLMKKLESLNISYVNANSADDYESCSSVSEKGEISSVSSSCISSQHQMELQFQKAHLKNSGEKINCHEAIAQNSNENVIFPTSQKDGDKDDLEKADYNGSNSLVTKDNIGHEGSDQEADDNVDNSMALVEIKEDTITTPRNEEDHNDSIDNSMVLVVVDSMVPKEEKHDVPICNGNVKDVLDALRYARESLQASIEMRRHMNSNISQTRLNGISC
uniref:uncharacterized protein LOC122605895 n=1 Tax=Erigeron canadensis TaxID=72917 RepID=UPI001CB8B9D2|nr:uncharacterized protein LOC122605895 [Erigeron canadensis]